MPTQRITFPSHSGETLSARLDLRAGAHLATAIFAHCFTCGKDIPAACHIAARLAGMGIAVLRFDFTGLDHSEGEFANTSFTSNVDDLVAAAAHLTSTGIAPYAFDQSFAWWRCCFKRSKQNQWDKGRCDPRSTL